MGIRDLEVGAWLVDGDGHLWCVVRVAPGAVTLSGRSTEQKFPVAPDGSVVSDREFSPVEVDVWEVFLSRVERESEWGDLPRLGLELWVGDFGHQPRPGDEYTFSPEQETYRVTAVDPGAGTLSAVLMRAPGTDGDRRASERFEYDLAEFLAYGAEGLYESARVAVCDHGYAEGAGCPVCDADGESFESYRESLPDAG